MYRGKEQSLFGTSGYKLFFFYFLKITEYSENVILLSLQKYKMISFSCESPEKAALF